MFRHLGARTLSRPPQKTNTSTNLNTAYVAYVRQLEQQEESHQNTALLNFEYQAKARSRQLETLLHLSRFSDHLVLISAPSGAGKTTFIHQFLQQQSADTCIAHLCPQAPVSASWVVAQLVQQLPVQLPDNAHLEDSILAIQDLAQQLTTQEEVLLLVVDDAQWLDDEALDLLANMLPHSEKVASRPHVILCANHTVVERIEAPEYKQLRQERFYHLVLAPFNQEESAEYLRQRLLRMGVSQGLAPIQLLQLHQLAKGNPGYLNMLANKALTKGGFVQQAGLPLLHIAATVVMVSMLVGIWLFNTYTFTEDASGVVILEPVKVQPLVVKSIDKVLPPLEPTPPEPEPESESIALTPKLVEPEPERIVQPALKPILPKMQSWPKATAKTKQPYGYMALLKVPPQHYSLQVLGARLEATLEAFLAEHSFSQPYYVIQLERSGEPWYLLLVGDYADIDDARNSVKTLPVALRNQQPWPRQVVKIQQQIRNKFNTSGE